MGFCRLCMDTSTNILLFYISISDHTVGNRDYSIAYSMMKRLPILE